MDNSTTPPMNGDKLSGQLVIKAQLGDDIRKMMIHNEDLTFNGNKNLTKTFCLNFSLELVLMMERIFTGKISNSDELTIKYLDNDGDKITLLNDSDLTVALHFHKLLRLFVIVNGNEQINVNSTDKNLDTKTFHNELQELKNSVQTILDRLQLSTNELPTATVSSSTTNEFDPHQQRSATPDNIRSNLANNEHQTAPTGNKTVFIFRS
jgi:protein TFG